MSTQPIDIIGTMKELQEKCQQPNGQWVFFRDEKHRLLSLFPTIAQALLSRDEALKVAVEALEVIANDAKPENLCHGELTREAEIALGQIRFLTQPHD